MKRLVLIAIVVIVLGTLAAQFLDPESNSQRRAAPAPAPGAGQRAGGGLDPRVDGGSTRRRAERRPDTGRDWKRPDGGRSPGWGEQKRREDGGETGAKRGSQGGRALRPAKRSDPSIMIKIPVRVSSSSGTAFSIDSRGLWMTARHVVDGCPKVYVLTGPRRGMLVKRVYVHPSADIAFIVTERGAPAFAFAWETLRTGQTGYHFGYPKGKPGDVSSRLIGRRIMRVRGRYNTAEPIVAWAERVRVPDSYDGLGGISGGPAFDARGRIIGVTVAGTVRRGRVYTTAMKSMKAAMARARVRLRDGDGRSAGQIPSGRFANYAGTLRRRLSVAKVICLVKQRRRRGHNPRRPRY